MKSVAFFSAKGIDASDGIEGLLHRLPMVSEKSMAATLVLFDTFDWRLYNASRLLYRLDNTYLLYDSVRDRVLQQQTIETQPQFVWQFPDSALQAKLEPIIEMRALMPLVELKTKATSYRVLNKDEKTVVRLKHWAVYPPQDEAEPPINHYVAVRVVRGYRRHLRRVQQHLLDLDFQPSPHNMLLDVVALGDKTPGDYATKINVALTPTMPAAEATKIILRFLTIVMRQNEAGIKADIDTEFLHDFRVAIRRTRSALSQIKGVFPQAQTERFKQDFSSIGKMTNDLRDLDVYLLAEDRYKAMLPDTMRHDINPLMTYLKRRRSRALKEVIKALNSETYESVMQAWDTFLTQPVEDAPNAFTPSIELAKKRIYKKYRRIVKWGQAILENMEDEQLHALRIECKKLRYLMEFFESLFPRNRMVASIKQLKRLQANLGDFNDLCVQEAYLQRLVDEMPPSHDSKKLFLAMGGLIGSLQRERLQVKAEFADAFAQFSTPANKKQFKKLFAN